MITIEEQGERLSLTTPTALPNAAAFLWNTKMMIHMNCRGYAVAQFMQPEPAKYAHAPNLEAKTFMQPEQPYYQHHPGRFFYLKDDDSQVVFSVPYEPVRKTPKRFNFSAGKSDICWTIEQDDLTITIRLCLAAEDPLELWKITIENTGTKARNISLYPYFPVGYMSWMNQSGIYHPELNGIVCSSITPYQKYQEYDTIKHLKDKTFLIADTPPVSWEANQATFEGEGGLAAPNGLLKAELEKGDARYETPTCVLQYRANLKVGEGKTYRFIFGPARKETEIKAFKQHYFSSKSQDNSDPFETNYQQYQDYISKGKGVLHIDTPDKNFDDFVNHWLPRQAYYHGETNRLSTDPQTRNYLQDNMGMSYIVPETTRQAFLTALQQQNESGAMPDGILIHESATLKYINQVPHTDHCVWLPICLKAYLDETNDYALLTTAVPFADSNSKVAVFEHIHRAMRWLYANRDSRGLSYIDQGDWCDPMNMVGPKGKGVSGWLTLAASYAMKVWAEICTNHGDSACFNEFSTAASNLNKAVNDALWDGNWYARGITDNGNVFGGKNDPEGRIFLNPQGWALLSGAANESQKEKLLSAVETQLETPYGLEMLGPPFTKMREDIGRVTQKHPGSAENGSVYNHAAAFYIYALYEIKESDMAFRMLRKMIPGPNTEDLMQRGQLPLFIPNYYRGAYQLFPRTAGRSSQLFNTGTAPWFYRILIEGLFGLSGSPEGLRIAPQLPSHWKEAQITRDFRGSKFRVQIVRKEQCHVMELKLGGTILTQPIIPPQKPGVYDIHVTLPITTS